MHFVTELFDHYGYIILFGSLVLELIAVPMPGEALMTYCGFLVFQGKLNWAVSILIASAGVILGITVSHWIGEKLGIPFFKKYGHYIHMGPEKLDKTSKWFERYGEHLLIAAYFIPGVRHITGYFSGITGTPFKRFAFNAYAGALIWTSTFISLGKVLGSDWEKMHGFIKKYLIIGGVILGIIILLAYSYRNYKVKIIDYVFSMADRAMRIFHSLGRIKIAVAGAAVVFIGLLVLVISLIQDYFANEFSQFDAIVTFVVKLIFSENWLIPLNLFWALTSVKVLIILSILIVVWILVKGKNPFLEIRFLIISVWGGWLLGIGLRLLFHRLGPSGQNILESIKYTFPSEQSLLSVIACGFASFIVLRHSSKKWPGTLLSIGTLLICLLAGITAVFYQIQYPSDVVSGYVFGGVWLSLNIILLEIFRILPRI